MLAARAKVPMERRRDDSDDEARGWRDTASYTRFRGPGCYGYQIDGTTFSRVIVFSAEP